MEQYKETGKVHSVKKLPTLLWTMKNSRIQHT